MIYDNSVIYDEIIETVKKYCDKNYANKKYSTNINWKKVICKVKNFYILLAFSMLIFIAS